MELKANLGKVNKNIVGAGGGDVQDVNDSIVEANAVKKATLSGAI
ncbi:MAG: hypothetical protein V4508_15050 [Pseudomonadota bacterium]